MGQPDVIGHYRVLRRIGAGGMGEVFIAHDEKLNRQVAIKAIRGGRKLDGAAKQRFLREARILSSLDHPHICKIHGYIEADETDESDYLVLEFVEGVTLDDAVQRDREPATCLREAEQIAQVLVTTHAEGVVHRDLKPMNVMVTPEGDVRVLDFGLAQSLDVPGIVNHPSVKASEPEPGPEAAADPARTIPLFVQDTLAVESDGFRTAAGRITGTPHYMSPEQARGEIVTAASDMYSFGLLLQFMFTGLDPYPSDLDYATVLERARDCETRPVTGVGRGMRSLIEDLKRPAPADRPTSEQALRRIRAIIDAPRRLMRRVVVAVLVLVAVGAGVKYTLDLQYERSVAVAAQREAERRRDQAESLIDFMLGDLRSRLSELDRLDVLDAVGDQAMDYYASLSEADLDDDELYRRSTALRQIGQVALASNNLPSAARAFDEALTLASSVVVRNPGNDAWRLALGEAEFYVGNVRWLQRDLDGALQHFETYKTVAEDLVQRDPGNATYQLELSYGHTNVGAVYQERGDLDLARHHVGESIVIKRALVDAHPDEDGYRESLANGLSWLGALSLQSGDLRESLRIYEEEGQMRDNYDRTHPSDMNGRFLRSICLGHLGRVSGALGRVEPAVQHFASAIELGRSLVLHDPGNGDWRRELALVLTRFGDLQVARGETEASALLLAESEQIFQTLIEADPTNRERQLDVIYLRRLQGEAARARHDLKAAPVYCDLAVDRLEESFGDTGDRDADLAWAQVRLLRGLVLADAGRRKEAHSEWTLGIERVAPFARGSRDPDTQSLWARTLLCLQETETAEPVVADLLERGFREPRFMAFLKTFGIDP